MATKQELIDGLQTVSTSLDKISGETTALNDKVAELEQALGNVDNIPAEVMTLLDEVKAKVKAVDDMVTDAVPEQPGGETPTDPAPVDPNAPQNA